MKKAILFGASGFVGSYLLEELLNDSDYELVTIMVRKSLNIQHPKLKMLIGDYSNLPELKESIVADDVFIALGTTKKKPYPTRVEIKHNKTKGWVVLDQIRTIDRKRVVKCFDTLTEKEIMNIKSTIQETYVD